MFDFKMTRNVILNDILHYYGGATEAANAIDVSRQAIYKLKNDHGLPALMALRFEIASCGYFKAIDTCAKIIEERDE